MNDVKLDLFEIFRQKKRNSDILKWSNKFKVGYSVIDQQHKRLFTIVEQLHDVIHKPEHEASEIERIAVTLRNYTIYHFGAEERILQNYNCSLYSSHKKEHANFIATIERLFPKLISDDLEAQEEVHIFLQDWLVTHVTGSDKKWSEWIKRKFPNAIDLS